MPPDWIIGPRKKSSAGPSVCQSVQPKYSGRQEATVGSGSEQDGDRRLDDNPLRCEVHPATTPAVSSVCPPLNMTHSRGMPEWVNVLLC